MTSSNGHAQYATLRRPTRSRSDSSHNALRYPAPGRRSLDSLPLDHKYSSASTSPHTRPPSPYPGTARPMLVYGHSAPNRRRNLPKNIREIGGAAPRAVRTDVLAEETRGAPQVASMGELPIERRTMVQRLTGKFFDKGKAGGSRHTVRKVFGKA